MKLKKIKIKEGIDYTKINVYDAIGRPDLKPNPTPYLEDMYYENREAMYYEKDPMRMTEEEAKISVAYWRAKYEGARENFVNIQTDLDRLLDWVIEQQASKKSQ